MPQRTDLYTVLNIYARRNNTQKIDIENFIVFLEKYAKRVCEERPEWIKWTEETGIRVWMDINRLAEEGKVVVEDSEAERSVYLSYYFLELVKDAYRNPDKDSGAPFPDEVSLNLEIPREQIRPLNVSVDLPRFLAEEGQNELLPIIKIIFPNERGSALVPSPMIPMALLEFSILKVRDYLQRHGNKEYIHRKLSLQLANKEDYLRETLDKIMMRPADSLNDLKEGREISFFFWAHFCSLVKNDLNQKNELLSEELGALQSIYIIEVCSNFFKAKTVKSKEIEIALKNFELEMEKPPYYYSREAIAKFKDNRGFPLLGVYTQNELDAYIKKRTSEPSVPHELPDFLLFNTKDNKTWLIKKNKLLPLCARLLTETRAVIIKVITRRWKKMLKEFVQESAMDDDPEFERLVMSYTEEYAPMLITLLKDTRLRLVHEEIEASEKGIPESSRLFQKNELLPLHVLLLLKRKQLISDIKILMPFWYSIPIINVIIAFFINPGRKKKKIRKEEAEKTEKKGTEDPLKELRNAAADAAKKLVPQGKSLDACLDDLASRWGHLVDRKAKQDLVEDVNTLVRDKLRSFLRLQRNAAVNADTLDKLANSIMDNSPGLLKISEQNILFLYVKLYLVKILINH